MDSADVREFSTNIFDLWHHKWLLLTSGDFDKKKYNTMTVAWGSLGVMWNRPFAQVVVRPTRYTFEFMEEFETFTLCSFPDKYKSDLELLGTKSGRDGDKISETNLDVVPARKVAAPAFKQADLILECTKLYWQDLNPEYFIEKKIDLNYPNKDYHRIYFGEIVDIQRKKTKIS